MIARFQACKFKHPNMENANMQQMIASFPKNDTAGAMCPWCRETLLVDKVWGFIYCKTCMWKIYFSAHTNYDYQGAPYTAFGKISSVYYDNMQLTGPQLLLQLPSGLASILNKGVIKSMLNKARKTQYYGQALA